MINYQYLKNCQYNDELMESYFELTQKIFHFDLKDWRKAGFWQDKYIPHSLICNNKVIANISASIMNLQLEGKDIQAVQLGSVGVLPDYRGKGLSKILMDKVLEEYKSHPLVFLFARNGVSQFYQKFGFRRFDESLPFISLENIWKRTEAEKISINSQHIKRLLEVRLQRSSILDARENPSIYWFHLMYNFSENIYYIEGKDVIFIAEYKDDAVYVYDVLSEKDITFDEIKSYVVEPKTKKVVFHFTPDWLRINYDVVTIEGNALYAYGEFLENMKNCKFPETSIT